MKFRLRLLRRTPMRALFLCAAALLQTASMPVLAQSPSGVFALGNSGAAQSIKASQLTSEWRRFTPNAEQTTMLAALSHMQMTPTHFYTRGETVQSGKETYLVAYRRTPAPPQRRRGGEMQDDDGDGTPNDQEEAAQRLPANAVLTLSLLNLRVMGDLADVRAFDPARDITDPIDEKKAALAGANERSTRNLKMIGLGLLQYVQDYDERYPPMRSAQGMREITEPQRGDKPITVQRAIQPYVRDMKIFAHPITRQLYRPNIAVSGRNQSEIEDSARVVAFWESAPAADGRRAVLYIDGHVKRELETDWPRIMATSNRLLPPRNLAPRKKGRRQIRIRPNSSLRRKPPQPQPTPTPSPRRT